MTLVYSYAGAPNSLVTQWPAVMMYHLLITDAPQL
jgi:hypothetical protein